MKTSTILILSEMTKGAGTTADLGERTIEEAGLQTFTKKKIKTGPA